MAVLFRLCAGKKETESEGLYIHDSSRDVLYSLIALSIAKYAGKLYYML